MTRKICLMSGLLLVAGGIVGCAAKPEPHIALVHVESSADPQVGRVIRNSSERPDEQVAAKLERFLESESTLLGADAGFDSWVQAFFMASEPNRQMPDGMLRMNRIEAFPKLVDWPVAAFEFPESDDVYPMKVYSPSSRNPMYILLYPDFADPAYDEMVIRRFIPRSGLEYGVDEARFRFRLDSDGAPTDIVLASSWSGDERVQEYLLAQLRGWRFHPVVLGGEPQADKRYELQLRIHSGRTSIGFTGNQPLPRIAGPLDGSVPDHPGSVPRAKVLPAPAIR